MAAPDGSAPTILLAATTNADQLKQEAKLNGNKGVIYQAKRLIRVGSVLRAAG